MAQTAQVFRYRPVLVFIATAAAAIGAYKIYATIADVPAGSELHRSNAIHRNRARRPSPDIEVTAPSPDRPLGTLSVRQGSLLYEYDLHSGSLPTRDIISQAVGSVSEDIYGRAMHQAIYAILLNCSPLNVFGTQEQVTRGGLLPLIGPLQIRNAASMTLVRNVLVGLLSHVDVNIIDSALHGFMLVAEPEPSIEQQATDIEGADGTAGDGGQGIAGLLYYIAEENATIKAYEHRGICCESCGDSPICGLRWHCLNCPDYDLCSTCKPMTAHPKTHVFVEIKIPIPVLSQPSQFQQSWYPGDSTIFWPPLPRRIKNMLVEHHGFQEQMIDALYDQFSCLANTVTSPDNTGVEAGIDGRAFRKALAPERWPQRSAPNAIFDRMFAFYDVEEQGFISFGAFVSGMAYLRGPQRFEALARALNGFDIDGDGYVDRADFVRLFRAKYVLVRQLVSDMVDAQEADQCLRAMSTLRSSQPISSFFRDDEIPHGEVRRSIGKQTDVHGDLLPVDGTKTILDERDPWPAERPQHVRGGTHRNVDASPHERLRDQLSRFEEMLNGEDDDEPARFTMRGRQSNDGTVHRVITDGEGPDATEGANGEFSNTDAEVDQDALWQVVEQSFNDMLDPLFLAKEQDHQEASCTKLERTKWRKEIDQAVADRHAFRKELQAGSQVDPLMATAFESQDAVLPHESPTTITEPQFRAELVSTDTQSLEQREAEIAGRPLEKLLETAGYGTIDGSEENPEQLDAAHHGILAMWPTSVATDEVQDPTMPQHRPNSSAEQRSAPLLSDAEHKSKRTMSSGRLSDVEIISQPPPSPHRLLRLAELDRFENEIHERGGTGRLSIDEVEQLVKGDTSRELRGLVIGWLDWASF